MDIKVFYSVLEYFCTLNNLSLSGAAIKAGLDSTCLNKSKTIESGRWVRMDTFLKLCEVLEITPAEFFIMYANELKQNEREINEFK